MRKDNAEPAKETPTITLYSVTTNSVKSQIRALPNSSGVWYVSQTMTLLDSPPVQVELWQLSQELPDTAPRYFLAPMRTRLSDVPLTQAITIP